MALTVGVSCLILVHYKHVLTLRDLSPGWYILKSVFWTSYVDKVLWIITERNDVFSRILWKPTKGSICGVGIFNICLRLIYYRHYVCKIETNGHEEVTAVTA